MKYTVLLLSVFSCLLTVNRANAQVTIVDENFDNGIPSTFLLLNKDGYTPHADVAEYTDAWVLKNDPTDETNKVASSTSYFDQPGMANRWMILPNLTLGSFGNNLSWTAKSHDASYAEAYLVLASTTNTEVESFTDTLAVVPVEDNAWTTHNVDLSELGLNNQTVHIAFVLRTIDGFKFYLDSIKVEKDNPASVTSLAPSFSVNVYPNPTSDYLSVQSDAKISHAVIRNFNGAIVATSTATKMDVHTLQNGVYFIELTTDKGKITQRFIKY